MNRFQSLVHGEGEGGLDGGTTFIDNGDGGSEFITGEFSGIGDGGGGCIDSHTTVTPAWA